MLSPAIAKAPKLNTQAPPFYRFTIGDFEAAIATDGPLPLGDPHKNFNGLSDTEMNKQLTDNFLPHANAVLEQNPLVVNTGDKLIVFDTGMGSLINSANSRDWSFVSRQDCRVLQSSITMPPAFPATTSNGRVISLSIMALPRCDLSPSPTSARLRPTLQRKPFGGPEFAAVTH